ncbi:shugoshin 1 isoform X3 [Fundulus heteroclitus]|uniref:shugoshin 1 isoform X3 n=1 Tax=Fundulus heteroclitus TaxID=8078 RepID=UPI00165AD020|nr:shugoshin 1 isoform X3 [Fundulus heteroclitus]
MLSMKKMAPSKPSKQRSTVASKIKNKMLNTSSFLKVSLKTNNKALALALQAQKEKSRQLEMEVVHLQKQVEALCFELAVKKYKQRKLLLILKEHHSNTLQHLDMVAELLSHNDSSRLPESCNALTRENRENVAPTWHNDQLVPQPENSRNLFCPNQNVEATTDLPERSTTEDVFGVLTRCSKTPDIYHENAEERRLSQRVQFCNNVTFCPSGSSLRNEVKQLSRAFSQSGSEINSVLHPQNKQTDENAMPPFSSDVNALSVSALETEPQLKQTDHTVLLNTSMEITQTNAVEIDAVESKVKKKAHSCKPKVAKSPQADGGSSADVPNGLDQRPKKGPAEISTQTVQQPPQEKVLDPQLPRTLSKNVKTSRIPKRDIHPKAPESNADRCDSASQGLDDYFSDPQAISLKPVGNEPKVYRRSETKVRRRAAVIQNVPSAAVLLLSCDDEICESRLEKILNKEEVENVEPRPPDGSTFYPEEAAHSESVENQLSEDGRKTQNKPTCSNSPDLDQDPSLTAEPHCKAEELPDAVAPSAGKQPSHSDLHPKTCGSSKRPLVETSEHNLQVLPAGQHDCLGSEYHKHKKSRREEAKGSRKKKTLLEKLADDSDTRQKKKTDNSNNKVSSENEAGLYQACRDEAPVCSIYGPKARRVGRDDLQPLHSQASRDICEIVHDPKASKAREDPKPHRKTKVCTVSETRKHKEKCVPLRPSIWDKSKSVSPNGTRTSITSDETAHQNVGDLLLDVPLPWMVGDLSTGETESNSLPSSPTRSTSPRLAVTEDASKASPAGRVLTMATNNFTSPDKENVGRGRRRNCFVDYKEPPLNSKIRRGDKFTDTSFLSSPLYKHGKKKRKKTEGCPVKSSNK